MRLTSTTGRCERKVRDSALPRPTGEMGTVGGEADGREGGRRTSTWPRSILMTSVPTNTPDGFGATRRPEVKRTKPRPTKSYLHTSTLTLTNNRGRSVCLQQDGTRSISYTVYFSSKDYNFASAPRQVGHARRYPCVSQREDT
jgi:hypothetical protein